jgi:hypothetical protein
VLSWLILTPTDRIDLEWIGVDDLLKFAQADGVLWWNRQGIIGYLSPGFLRSVCHLYMDYRKLRAFGLGEGEISKSIRTIDWAQVAYKRPASECDQKFDKTLNPKSRPKPPHYRGPDQ